MERDRGVGIAESLQHADLVALQADDAGEHDVEEKGRDREEDRRRDDRHGAKLLELAGDEEVRDLVLAAIGAGAAIGPDQVVEPVDHLGLVGAARQLERDVVERAVEIEGVLDRLAAHPHHAEALVVREQAAGADGVDEFGRERGAADGDLLAAAVDDRREAVADGEMMGLGEGLVDHGLVVAARLGQGAGGEIKIVQDRRVVFGDRDDLPDHRLVETRNVAGDVIDDALIDRRDAGDFRDPVGQRDRRALQAREDVGETILAVEGIEGALQGMQHPERHHADRDAASHHQADRQHLALHVQKVAEKLAVEGADQHGQPLAAYHCNSCGETFVSLTRHLADGAVREGEHPVGHGGDGLVVGDHRGGGAELAC